MFTNLKFDLYHASNFPPDHESLFLLFFSTLRKQATLSQKEFHTVGYFLEEGIFGFLFAPLWG